jgi:WD40 repeat protein
VLHRNDDVTQLVRTEDGSIVAELDAGALNHRSVFTPDGRYVMTNNNSGDAPFLRFFDVADGTFVAGLGSEEDEPGGGWWTEFTRDGTALVVGGYDGVVRIYDVSTLLVGGSDGEAIMKRIPAHATFMILVEVSADGSMVASSAWDEPAKLWDLNDGRLLGQFGDEQPTAVAFHPTEPRLFVSQSGYVTVHTLDAAELMEIARAGLSRGLTDEECRRYLRRPCDAA